MLNDGDAAPLFTLPADDGGPFSLKDLKGRPVVLYFYPKDDTSGCTAEAKDFTALAREFEAEGALVVGISPDSTSCHRAFKEKYALAVRLAADEDKSVCRAFGTWVEKSMYGRKYMGVERSTFLIDGAGMIARSWRKVNVSGHAREVLAAVRALAPMGREKR